MMVESLSRRALALAVLFVVADCGGTAGSTQLAPSSRVNTSANALERTRSWMAPEAKSEDLLYISDYYGVHVFSYPKGTHVGDLAGFAEPQGLCTDRAGDIFVTDALARHVYEFAHGGTKPIAVFYDNYVDFNPENCSVDPITGNLAVAIPDLPSVVIFPDAKQKPVVYSDPYSIIFWCAYDDKGNLFVEQVRQHRKFYIGELPRGATKFKNLFLDPRVGGPSSLQFDGQHIVVEGPTSTLYQLRFSGSNAIVISSTPLNGAKQIEQFWIQKRRVIGPDLYGTTYFWKYPLGGSPAGSIQGFTLPYGATVSVSP